MCKIVRVHCAQLHWYINECECAAIFHKLGYCSSVYICEITIIREMAETFKYVLCPCSRVGVIENIYLFMSDPRFNDNNQR